MSSSPTRNAKRKQVLDDDEDETEEEMLPSGQEDEDANEDAEEDDGESDEDEDEEQTAADARIRDLRQVLDRITEEVRDEKAACDKSDAARMIDQEQKRVYEEQIEAKKRELVELEQESKALMVEGRMYQLASREYDMPLKDTWVDKPEQAMVVDLSRISMSLEQAIRAVNSKDQAVSSTVDPVKRELEVIHVDSKGVEQGKTNIPINSVSTLEEVLTAACAYWSLNSDNCELENSQGRKLVRRDAVPAGTTQLVLKDLSTEEEEHEEEDEQDLANKEADIERESQRAGDAFLSMNNSGFGDGGDTGGMGSEGEEGDLEDVQAGRDVITKRDSRVCHHLEFLIVILLATTFTSMSLEFRRVPEGFQLREATKRLFADQPVVSSEPQTPSPFTFDEIDSEDKMWAWMNQTATIYSASARLPSYGCVIQPFANVSVPVVTRITVSQLRVAPDQGCAQVTLDSSCYSYFSSPQVAVPFANVPPDAELQTAFTFGAFLADTNASTSSCASWPNLVTDSFPGMYAYYPARQLDAYSLLLSYSNAKSQLDGLRRNNWVDLSTRLVTLSFNTYDQVNNGFVNVIASFEYLPNGGVFPRWNSIPVFLQVNDDSFDVIFLIFIIVLVSWSMILFILGLSSKAWLFADSLLMVFVALYFAGNVQLDSWFEDCQLELTRSAPGYFDLRGVSFQSQMVGNFQGIIIVLLALRLTKHLDASPSSSLIFRAIGRSYQQYISLSFFVLTFASAFALMAHFIFGRTTLEFSVADLAYASLWISYSVTNSAALVGTVGWGAIVLSIAAFTVLYLVLFYVCFAVTASAYFAVRDEVRSRGYFWMRGTRAAERYAEEISLPSGTIMGIDAQERLRKHRSAKRTYGTGS